MCVGFVRHRVLRELYSALIALKDWKAWHSLTGDRETPHVLWFGTRVTCEMVSDGGGRYILADIAGLHTLSLLLASLVAHDRANHTGRVSYTNIKEGTLYKTISDYLWVQYTRLDREVLTPPPCE